MGHYSDKEPLWYLANAFAVRRPLSAAGQGGYVNRTDESGGDIARRIDEANTCIVRLVIDLGMNSADQRGFDDFGSTGDLHFPQGLGRVKSNNENGIPVKRFHMARGASGTRLLFRCFCVRPSAFHLMHVVIFYTAVFDISSHRCIRRRRRP